MALLRNYKKTILFVLLTLYCIDPVAIWMLNQGQIFADFRSFYMAGFALLNQADPYNYSVLQNFSANIQNKKTTLSNTSKAFLNILPISP